MDHRSLVEAAQAIADVSERLGFVKGPPKAKPLRSDNLTDLFDALVTDEMLRKFTRPLFIDEHYARAVEEANKYIINAVKDRSRLSIDGPDLMHKAFSETKPVLKLNDLRSQSNIDEQMGYRFIFAGCASGIRNPRAHLHDLRDDPDVALELLVLANHLVRALARTKLARARRKK